MDRLFFLSVIVVGFANALYGALYLLNKIEDWRAR